LADLTSEDQRRYEQFREEGFVLIDDALADFDPAAVSGAFEHARAATEDAWRAMVASGVYRGGYGHGPDAHSIEDPYRFDDLFLDLAENRRLAALLRAVIGPGMQVTEIFAHVHHAGTGAHTGWHRDWPTYRHPKYALKAKVFYFLDDQTPDMGCFSLVPGSHRLDPFPPHEYYEGETLEAMPGMQKIVCPAGSALIWDVTLWHTATANVSDRDRRMLIYAYQPFFVKNWECRRPPENVIAWADTPARRQLMGIHAVDGRAGWDRFDVDYLPEHEMLAKAKVI
jgi:ectoine hydroxylase-related dioxygenase (phytanoyl-CoA dioxygenase family)